MWILKAKKKKMCSCSKCSELDPTATTKNSHLEVICRFQSSWRTYYTGGSPLCLRTGVGVCSNCTKSFWRISHLTWKSTWMLKKVSRCTNWKLRSIWVRTLGIEPAALQNLHYKQQIIPFCYLLNYCTSFILGPVSFFILGDMFCRN